MPPFSINVDQYNLLLIHFRFIFVNDADAIEDAKQFIFCFKLFDNHSKELSFSSIAKRNYDSV